MDIIPIIRSQTYNPIQQNRSKNLISCLFLTGYHFWPGWRWHLDTAQFLLLSCWKISGLSKRANSIVIACRSFLKSRYWIKMFRSNTFFWLAKQSKTKVKFTVGYDVTISTLCKMEVCWHCWFWPAVSFCILVIHPFEVGFLPSSPKKRPSN